jgi:hypothetical protein
MACKLTLAHAKRIVASRGFMLIKVDGEFIVKPRGAGLDDARNYFTNDLLDAVETAKRMAS